MRKAGGLRTIAITALMATLTVGSVSAQDKTDKKNLSGIVSAEVRSGDIMQPGIERSEGIVSYGLGAVQYGNLDAFVWTDRNHADGQWHEVDFGAGYNIPLGENTNLRAGAQAWLYPSGLLGDHDIMLDASIVYKNGVDLEAQVMQRVTDGLLERGTAVMIKAGKSFIKNLDEIELTVTPSISTAYLDRFFQEGSSVTNIAPAMEFSVSRGDYSLDLEAGRQIGIDGTTKTTNYGSIGFSRSF